MEAATELLKSVALIAAAAAAFASLSATAADAPGVATAAFCSVEARLAVATVTSLADSTRYDKQPLLCVRGGSRDYG